MEITTNVAVVGLGAFGSAALWQLAERGVDCVGLEQFTPGHDRGSTHGSTRLFRVACLEHPGLVPLALRARDLWYDLGEKQNVELLRQVGGLMIGPQDGRILAGTIEAATAHGLDVEELTTDQIRERYPLHAGIPDDYAGVWEPHAGVVKPEESVTAAVRQASALGATVLENTPVVAIDTEGSQVVVRTTTGLVRARKVIVATGAWLDKLIPGVVATPRRTPMLWFTQKDLPENASLDNASLEDTFGLDAFPVFIRQVDETSSIWGHGAIWGHDVKIGLEDTGPEFFDCDPDTVDRGINPKQDWAQLSDVVSRAVPALDPVPVRAITCMVTNSRDHQFLIGALTDRPNVIVAGGCSGHGFKHASGIGEHLAELATDRRPTVDLSFTDPNRNFSDSSASISH